MPKKKENIDPNQMKSNNSLSCESINKRIGILRRSEIDPVPKTPQTADKMTKNLKELEKQSSSPYEGVVVDKLSQLTSPIFSIGIENELALTVPASMQSLRSFLPKKNTTTSSKSSSTSQKSVKSTKNRHKSIPYWLKPTPVHPYPYNFIMAVRKKLESITKNQMQQQQQKLTTEPKSMNFNAVGHSNKEQTPVARPKYFRRTNSSNFRQNLANTKTDTQLRSQEMLATLDAIPQLRMPDAVVDGSAISPIKNPLEKSNKHISSTSDLNTNFSSITLQISGTNTTSDFSSLISDGNKKLPAVDVKQTEENNDDTLSVSSTIFSQSSPEKKKQFPVNLIPVPLSTENIDHLQVLPTKTKPLPDMSFVKTERGSEIMNKRQPRKVTSSKDLANESKDFDQTKIMEMLETFNKSLSHVISVNKQLHTALSNPSNLNANRPVNSDLKEIKSKSDNESLQGSVNQTLADDEQIYSSTFHDSSKLSTQQSLHSNQTNAIQSNRSESILQHSTNSNSSTKKMKSSTKSNSDTELISSRYSSKSLASIQEIIRQSDKSTSKSIQTVDVDDKKSNSIPSEIIQTESNQTISTRSNRTSTDKQKYSSAAAETVIGSPGKSCSQDDAGTATIQQADDTICDDQFSVKSLTQHSLTAGRRKSLMMTNDLNTSMCSDILAVFHQTDMEYSIMSTNDNQTVISEGNVSYSSIGMVRLNLNSNTLHT